jgi:MFS family permease
MTTPETRATRVPAFNRLWAAETLSILGQQVALLALPLIAAVTLSATPAQMGLLVAIETAPLLVFSLIAGVWIDQRPRRPVLIWTDALRAAALLLVPLAAVTGVLNLEVLYLVAFLVGTLSVYFNVAYQSILPDLVPAAALTDANSKLETSRAGGEVLGPGLGGALIGLIGVIAGVWVNIATFLISALLLGGLRVPEQPISSQTTSAPLSAQLREGLSYVWSHPLIRPLVLCASTLNFAEGLLAAVLVLYLSRDLELSPAQIGLVYMGSNVGFVLGAVFSRRIAARLRLGRAALWAALLAGLGLMLVPVSSVLGEWAIPGLVLARLLSGLGSVVFSIQHVTLRQVITPRELQGRMHASVRFFAGGVVPLGALLGGVLGQGFGVKAALLLAGLIGWSAWLWLWRTGVPKVLSADLA